MAYRPTKITIRVAIALAMAACGSSPSGPGGAADGGATDSGAPAEVTFYEQVAPILMDNCVSCHKPGGIAPFSLLTLADAKAVGSLIAPAVSSRRMPPWSADNSGSCHTYTDARWLSDRDIEVLVSWATGAQAAGDPANAPALPTDEPGLGRVDATLDMGVEYTPDRQLSDDYRCFVVDYGSASDQFLTAFEVRPGDPRVVHHILMFRLDSAAAETAAVARDQAETGPGYECFGGAGVQDSTIVGVWAPGGRVSRYPQGTGLRIPGGRKMIIQIHYNLSAGALPDRTRVDLELEPHVARPAALALVADLGLSLPPGSEYVETSGSLQIPAQVPVVSIWGLYPHMHTLGQTLRVDLASASSDSSCMLDVPRWDFGWQQFFKYADGPVVVRGGDRIDITCGYDTRGRTETVRWGEGTLDEMCLAFLYFTIGQ